MTQTTDDIQGYEDDNIEIVSGRGELPWTQVHDWIVLSGVPGDSVAAYVALKMHLNRETGQLNPGTVRLAKLLGLSRSDRVAKVVRPLVEIGAVEVCTYGMPRRNRYIVHAMPPKWYKGPISLNQWSRLHESEIAGERRRQAEKADRARDRRASSVTPESGVQELQETQNSRSSSVTPESGVQVTPESRLQVTPESGVHVPPILGVEPDEGEPDEGEPDEVPPPPPVDADQTTVVDVRDEEEESQNRDMIARDVLRRATAGLTPARFPNRDQARQLVILVVDALRRGWPERDLIRRIGDGDLTKVDSVYAVLRHRISQLGDPLPQPVPAPLVDAGPHTMSPDSSWKTPRQAATAESDKARVFMRTLARSSAAADRREYAESFLREQGWLDAELDSSPT